MEKDEITSFSNQDFLKSVSDVLANARKMQRRL